MQTANGTSAVPQESVGTCFNAQSYLGFEDEYGNGTRLNADLGGAIIACSYIVINALLPFLLVWSSDVTSSIFLLFSQTIPILIATLASVHTNNLSLFDAHFAVAVTGSPMSFYIAVSCIRYPFQKDSRTLQAPDASSQSPGTLSQAPEAPPRTEGTSSQPLEAALKTPELSVFDKISREAKPLVCLLGGLLFPCLWLSVSLITSFSSTAFRNSVYCKGVTLPRYLEFLAISSFTGALDIMGRRDLADDFSKRWGLGFLSLLFMLNWGAYLVHHREEIYAKVVTPIRELREAQSSVGNFRRVSVAKEYILLVWRVPEQSWKIISLHHPSMVVWLLLCLHWGWALGIAGSLTFDETQLRSYGQVLSLFVPIPAMWTFGKILYEKKSELISFAKAVPSFVRQGARFTFTGRYRPSPETRPPDPSYIHWSRARWTAVLGSAVAYLGLHGVWIAYYVRAGSMPNNRFRVNDPHKNWKPYSVCLYINGYICSVVCIFLAVAFFGFLPKWKTRRQAAAESKSPVSEKETTPLRTGARGREEERSQYQGVPQGIGFVLARGLAAFLCVSPIFAPFLALPIAQEWHWRHDCSPYPIEMILYGKSNSLEKADISISVARHSTPNSPPQRAWVHNYKFYTLDRQRPNLRIVEYVDTIQQASTIDGSALPLPRLKTLILDTEGKSFLACSDWTGALIGSTSNASAQELSLDSCTEGSGTYETQPYLRFAISSARNSSSKTYLQAQSKEWSFFNDAPSLSLQYVDGAGSKLEHLPNQLSPFRTALTKRNHPAVLKVCGEDVDVGLEVLAPLGVVMDALNKFAVYISRPRVLSDV